MPPSRPLPNRGCGRSGLRRSPIRDSIRSQDSPAGSRRDRRWGSIRWQKSERVPSRGSLRMPGLHWPGPEKTLAWYCPTLATKQRRHNRKPSCPMNRPTQSRRQLRAQQQELLLRPAREWARSPPAPASQLAEAREPLRPIRMGRGRVVPQPVECGLGRRLPGRAMERGLRHRISMRPAAFRINRHSRRLAPAEARSLPQRCAGGVGWATAGRWAMGVSMVRPQAAAVAGHRRRVPPRFQRHRPLQIVPCRPQTSTPGEQAAPLKP